MPTTKQYPSLAAFVDAHLTTTTTQAAIALRLGLTPPMLSRYLHGHSRPSRETAMRISTAHGIDLRGLLEAPSVHADESQRRKEGW